MIFVYLIQISQITHTLVRWNPYHLFMTILWRFLV
jgi:hypothetical protein